MKEEVKKVTMPLAFLILLYSHSYIIVDTIAITKLLFPKEEDFDKVMDDIEAMVGDVSNQVNKSNDIIKIMEKK